MQVVIDRDYCLEHLSRFMPLAESADRLVQKFRATSARGYPGSVRCWPTPARRYAEAGRLLWISLPTPGLQRLAGGSRPSADVTQNSAALLFGVR